MQRHFDDLRAVERLLIAGRLAEAKSLAFLLSRPARGDAACSIRPGLYRASCPV